MCASTYIACVLYICLCVSYISFHLDYNILLNICHNNLFANILYIIMIEKGFDKNLVFQSQQYSASLWAHRKVRHLTEN